MYFFAWIMRLIRVKCCSCSLKKQDIETSSAGDGSLPKYWDTLQRLIQNKIDLDFEHSPQGDWNELRDDMKNMRKEFRELKKGIKK